MLRIAIALPFIILLVGSCASAPAKKPAPEPAATVATTVADPAPATPAPTRPKLGRGECEESFDCVDTVGFPPTGQRWTCVEGKCGRAKLPDLNPDATPASADASDANSKDKPAMKKTKKRHN
jgi:hypothetical protein